jgi:L-fucose isomerase-like protein
VELQGYSTFTIHFLKVSVNPGDLWYNQITFMDIALVTLRSALSDERKASLDASSHAFLQTIDPHSEFSYKHLRDEKCPLTLFFIESGGSEAPFLKIYENYSSPYYLLAKGDNNSLASSLEILSFLQRQGLKGEILYGDPNGIYERIKTLYRIAEAKAYLKKAHYGLFGEPSDWLIASSVSFAEAQKKFGCSFTKITFEEFKEEIDKKQYNPPKFHPELAEKAKQSEVLEGALEIYGALSRLIAKYHLTAFSIRCFDLLGVYKNTSCLALALLNEEGITATCEGDEASLLSMDIIRSLTSEASFQCNPSVVNLTDRTMLLAHCTIPFSMVTSYSFMTHFESGLGIGIRGEMRTDPVTVFKLCTNLKDYHLVQGQIEENHTRENLCRTQITIKFDSDISDFLYHPYGNHLIVAYGRLAEDIEELMDSY